MLCAQIISGGKHEAIYNSSADINLIKGSHWLVYTDQSEGGADQPVL